MKLINILPFLILVSGCSIISEPDEVKRYTLSSLPEQPNNKPRRHHIVVDTPQLYPPLDNARLALRTSEQSIDYYACAEWGDRLANLIQESIIYSLQNSGKFSSVSRPGEGLSADYTLKIDVRDFQIVYNTDMQLSHAEVVYWVQLVRNTTRRVVSRRLIKTAIPLQEETMNLIARALNTAHLQATTEISRWLLKH